jgi:thioredoxin-like negative regulator of GroEL
MILLEFQTEGCPACVYMDREVFSRPEVAEALADWVPVRVDGNVERALSAQYGIEAFPTFLALAADGQVLAGFVGAREFTEFIDFLQLARERAAPGGQIPGETTPAGSGPGDVVNPALNGSTASPVTERPNSDVADRPHPDGRCES